MGEVRRPAWWSYPLACPHGHSWAPGTVIVSWTPCDCGPVKVGDPPKLGHLTVSCQADDCTSRWYKPRHDAETASDFSYPAAPTNSRAAP